MNLALDTNHDIFLTAGGQLATVQDEDELLQRIKTRLLTFLGEWWLDVELGVPYFQQILGFKPDLTLYRTLFTAATQAVTGVVSVDSMEVFYTAATRTLTVRFTCTGELGTVTGEITI